MRGRRRYVLKGYDRCKARTVKGKQCRNRAVFGLCLWHMAGGL